MKRLRKDVQKKKITRKNHSKVVKDLTSPPAVRASSNKNQPALKGARGIFKINTGAGTQKVKTFVCLLHESPLKGRKETT